MALDSRQHLFSKVTDGKVVEIDNLATRLGDMNLRTVTNFRITAAYENRPDLISLKAYGSYHFGWLIAYHNKIINPFEGFWLGRNIKIPSIEDFYRFYNRYKKSDTPIEVDEKR